MNLRQLEHVVALAEFRNFHRAADAIGLTQSALTQSIQKLEEECGVDLFNRSKREIAPTAYGLTVIQTARQVIAQLANMRRELDLMKNLQSGRLMVGCTPFIADALLEPALGRMLATYPELRFSLKVGHGKDLVDQMISGELDLYVGAPFETPDQRITWREIELPRLVLVCNPRHPLLELEEPTAADCLDYPIAAPMLSQSYRAYLAGMVGELRTRDGRDISSYAIESDDHGLVRRLVRSTNLIAAMFPTMVADEESRGLVRTIAIKEMDFPVPAVIGYPAQRPLPPAGQILLRELVAEADNLWARQAREIELDHGNRAAL